MHLSDQEAATVLAALRFWQANDCPHEERDSVHFAEHSPLKSAEIDDLCERINMPDADSDDDAEPSRFTEREMEAVEQILTGADGGGDQLLDEYSCQFIALCLEDADVAKQAIEAEDLWRRGEYECIVKPEEEVNDEDGD